MKANPIVISNVIKSVKALDVKATVISPAPAVVAPTTKALDAPAPSVAPLPTNAPTPKSATSKSKSPSSSAANSAAVAEDKGGLMGQVQRRLTFLNGFSQLYLPQVGASAASTTVATVPKKEKKERKTEAAAVGAAKAELEVPAAPALIDGSKPSFAEV